VVTPISTPTVGFVLPIPNLLVPGMKTKEFGLISKAVTTPGAL
jgi:hypothetical protein